MRYRTILALATLAPITAHAQAGTLHSGETRSAQLRSGEQASWTVEANAGELLTASVSSRRFDTVLDLYSPTGVRITTDDDGGDGSDSAFSDVQIPRAGRYRLVVRSYNDRESGAYSVRMDLRAGRSAVQTPSRNPNGRTVDVGPIRDGEALTEYLGTDSELRWTFRGRAGQRASLVLTDAGRDIDPFLELYAPSGALIASDDDTGDDLDSRIEDERLPETGTYVVVARDFGNLSQGELTLSLALDGRGASGRDDGTRGTGQGEYGGPGDTRNPVGRDIRGRLAASEQHSVRFEGRRGDVVTITLASSDFDAEVSLRSPDDDELARNDDADGLNSRISQFRLRQSGTYEVVVQAHRSSGTGSYVLHIDR